MNDEQYTIKTLQDALVRAASDTDFREQLTANPEHFREEYNITDEQIDQIKELGTLTVPFTDEAGLVVANYEDGGGGGGGGGSGGNGGGNNG